MEEEIRKAIERTLEQASKMSDIAPSGSMFPGASDRLFEIAVKADELLISGNFEGARRLLMVHGKM